MSTLKIATEFELTAPAEKFYNLFKTEAHHIPNTSQTGTITGIDVHEGDWETEGSIKIWNYSIEGEVATFKEKVEYDEVNKLVICNGIEGPMFEFYKTFKGIFQFIPKDDGSCIAKLTVEYEKLSDDVTESPDKYVRVMTNIVKDLDDHFIKA